MTSFFLPSERYDAHIGRLRHVWRLDDWTDEEIIRLREAIIAVAMAHQIDLTTTDGFRAVCLLLASEFSERKAP